jgi:DNA-binding MltR family transcriptional regulator
VQEPQERKLGTPLSEKEAEQYFRLREMLFEFSRLFDYDETNDRAIAIVGPAFLDTLLTEMLINFLVDDGKEVRRLIEPEGPLGTFGAKVSACYGLGLIGETIKSDLRIVAKIRNRFAHDFRANFADEEIKSWCSSLRWHRESLCEPLTDATTRDLFQVGVNQLVCHLNGLVGLALYHKREKSKSGSPRA